MTKCEDTPYLLCGLGDGSLLYFIMDTTGRLIEKKKRIVTTQPFTLLKHRSNVFAYEDHPILLTFSKDGQHSLSFTDVNISDVVHMCSVSAEAYPDSLAVATKSSVIIVKLYKSPEAKYPLGEEPRRIAHQAVSETFGVSTVQVAVRNFLEVTWIKKELMPQPIKDKTYSHSFPLTGGSSTSKASLADGPRSNLMPKTVKSMPYIPPIRLITTVLKDTDVHKVLVVDQHTFNILDTYEFPPPESITSLASAKLGDDPKPYYVVTTVQRLHDESMEYTNQIVVLCYDLCLRKLIKVTEVTVSVICHTVLELKGRLLVGMDGALYLYEWTADQKLHLLCNMPHQIAIKYLRIKDNLILTGDWLRSITLFLYKEEHPYIELVARDEYSKWTSAIEILSNNTFLVTENQENLFVLQVSW